MVIFRVGQPEKMAQCVASLGEKNVTAASEKRPAAKKKKKSHLL